MSSSLVTRAAPLHCCVLCGHAADAPAAGSLGRVRGNTRRFAGRTFSLWRCPSCATIHSLEPVDLADVYRDYALNERRLDLFNRRTLGSLLRRLTRAGLTRSSRVLDVGCGNGLFIDYLRQRGFTQVTGYDPYVERFACRPLPGAFDWVIANDVIEHTQEPRAFMAKCLRWLRPGGCLYVGTADAAGVSSMSDLEPHVMRLHQPFHRVLFTEPGLHRLGEELGLEVVRRFRRSYMDTPWPFGSYRFLDEYSRALGHEMERALDPASQRILLRRPRLWLFGLCGYFFPSAYEPAVLWRKPEATRLREGAS